MWGCPEKSLDLGKGLARGTMVCSHGSTMAQAPQGTDKDGPLVKFKKRRKRNKRRPIEAVPQDWARWDAYAKREGLNFSELARRALNNYCFLLDMRLNGLAATVTDAEKR